MKTAANNSRNFKKRISLFIFLMLITIIFFFNNVNGQNVIDTRMDQENSHDADFPGRRAFNAGVITTYTNITPPPALVGDVTYGISEKFSVGIIAGTTGAQSLAGVKINSTLLRHNNFRVIYRMVILYYPGRDGEYLFDKSDKFIMPWMLTMGAINAEWKTEKNIRWSVGMGALETHCIEGMKQHFRGESHREKVSPFELFHTLNGSVSIPLSSRLTFRPEVIAVMKDGRLIRTGDFKVFPINPFLKLIYTF
ncbi:MAG: hypothetical protein ABIR06_06365 [Cyclobacteriaceae bacterium]